MDLCAGDFSPEHLLTTIVRIGSAGPSLILAETLAYVFLGPSTITISHAQFNIYLLKSRQEETSKRDMHTAGAKQYCHLENRILLSVYFVLALGEGDLDPGLVQGHFPTQVKVHVCCLLPFSSSCLYPNGTLGNCPFCAALKTALSILYEPVLFVSFKPRLTTSSSRGHSYSTVRGFRPKIPLCWQMGEYLSRHSFFLSIRFSQFSCL